jgi:hypothetical protein
MPLSFAANAGGCRDIGERAVAVVVKEKIALAIGMPKSPSISAARN